MKERGEIDERERRERGRGRITSFSQD